MSKARLVITAVIVEKRPVAEVVATYGVSRSWLYELLARYRAKGEAALEPRSRRPHTSPAATPPPTVELVLRLRKELLEAGHDAGAEPVPGLRLLARQQRWVRGRGPAQQVPSEPQVVAALHADPGGEERWVPERGVVPHPARRLPLAARDVRRQLGLGDLEPRVAVTDEHPLPGSRESATRAMPTPSHRAGTEPPKGP
jgi:hypothetical protein